MGNRGSSNDPNALFGPGGSTGAISCVGPGGTRLCPVSAGSNSRQDGLLSTSTYHSASKSERPKEVRTESFLWRSY